MILNYELQTEPKKQRTEETAVLQKRKALSQMATTYAKSGFFLKATLWPDKGRLETKIEF